MRSVSSRPCRAPLWTLRRRYADLSWEFGLEGTGGRPRRLRVWIALDRMAGGAPDAGMPGALAAAPWTLRDSWIRVAGAIRRRHRAPGRRTRLSRLSAAPPDRAAFRNGFLPDVHLVFAAGFVAGVRGHARRPLARGTAAGALYALVALRTGRLSEADAAHATTNALLAAYVLTLQKWQFW